MSEWPKPILQNDTLADLEERLEWLKLREFMERQASDGISHDLRRAWREIGKTEAAIRDKKGTNGEAV